MNGRELRSVWPQQVAVCERDLTDDEWAPTGPLIPPADAALDRGVNYWLAQSVSASPSRGLVAPRLIGYLSASFSNFASLIPARSNCRSMTGSILIS